MTHYNMRSMSIGDIVSRVRDQLIDADSGEYGNYYTAADWMVTTGQIRDFFAGRTAQVLAAHSGRLELVRAMLHALSYTNGSAKVLANRSAGHDGAIASVPVGGTGVYMHWLPGASAEGVQISIPTIWFGNALTGEPTSEAAGDSSIVVTPLTGWGEGYAEVRPSDEILNAMPTAMRALATVTIPLPRSAGQTFFMVDTGQFTQVAGQYDAHVPTGESLATAARTAYRSMIRLRMQRPNDERNEAEQRAREAHRQVTRENYLRFVQGQSAATEQHVATLPFVPHGLSSSRRWGIEIEHPGARDVATPDSWRAVSDGSLRSAYDGWVEVQDFEPYDREETSRIYWESCGDAVRHNPRREVWDAERGEHIYEPNPDYISPRDCQACGQITRMVRVEPQTITHSARSGDCREFVSPILVSMHSKGLEQLMKDLEGKPTNTSAGVHVHVEASDLSKQQIATLVFGYDILEPLLEASYQRSRRDFCNRRPAEEVLSAARAARSDGIDPNSGDRYVTLNTHSLSRHGTVEFRAMGPVYDYNYLTRWAMLCRELVNAVAAGATTKDFAKIKKWQDLLNFMSKFGKEYVRAAVYELTGETGTAATLVKGDQPVTNSALDADLSRLMNGVEISSEAMQAFANAVNQLGVSADRLVGAGNLAEI